MGWEVGQVSGCGWVGEWGGGGTGKIGNILAQQQEISTWCVANQKFKAGLRVPEESGDLLLQSCCALLPALRFLRISVITHPLILVNQRDHPIR